MRYQYVVILKKTSARATDALSLLLCLFSALTFGYRSFATGHSNYLALVLAVALLAGPAFTLIFYRKNPMGARYRIWLLAAAIGWIGLTAMPWVGAFYFLLAFLEAQSRAGHRR